MKKILIVFRPTSQIHLVRKLREQMCEKGISVEAFNTVTWDFIDSDIKLPLFYRCFKSLFCVDILGKVIRKLINTTLLNTISKDYSYIDIHFFSRDYIRFVSNLKIPYKITIWGSDFYRATKTDAERKRPCYRNAEMIQVETSSVKRDFLKYEPTLSDKIRICNFGIDIIDEIDQLEESGVIKRERDKIVITCGYNGTEGQQHLLMIDSLKRLPSEYRRNIKMLIPATYGLHDYYKERIKKALSSVDFDYEIVDKHLSCLELAELRLNSDIALNIQITDTLSSSLLQHLYAGSILLVGDWLPYEVYDEEGFFYKKTNLDTITDDIVDCIDNLTAYQEMTALNRQKVRGFASWKSVSIKQLNIYRELISK